MASENEMLADIVAEFREMVHQSVDGIIAVKADVIADRIEAAWKREREPKPLTIPEWIDHEESIADIAAVLRRYVLPSLADRLMAAWKRERESLLTKQGENVNSGSVVYTGENKGGNAAAMREALTNLTRYKESDIRQLEQLAKRAIDNDIYGGGILQSMCEAIREGKEALSAPPRNCDVGTADEQMKRQHDTVCNTTNACPDSDWSCRKCFAKWAQMPYAEEGGAR